MLRSASAGCLISDAYATEPVPTSKLWIVSVPRNVLSVRHPDVPATDSAVQGVAAASGGRPERDKVTFP